MDFMGLGWMEIVLILIVAFLIWGPNRIVEIGRSLGKTMRAFKKAANDLTTQVTQELEEEKKQLSQENSKKKDG